jgi:vacuolar-type H+-ATPase subunit F/Vma7
LSVVALGDDYFITSLRAAGVDGIKVRSTKDAEDAVDTLVSEGRCKVIFVTERVALKLERKRSELARRRVNYPVFAVVPEMDGRLSEKSDKLYQLISQAVGAKLKLGEG